MSDNLLLIGDVAGQYDALMRLLKKCPDYMPISLGDMIDRGPDSKKVVEFFMKNGKAILGNHEHMMLDFGVYKFYNYGIWLEFNGGYETLVSFAEPGTAIQDMRIPDHVINWICSLPLYMEIDGAFISHAPKCPYYSLEECCSFVDLSFKGYESRLADCSIIWNREDPDEMSDKLQIFGHNGFHYYICDENKKDFAVCIDATRQNKLLAMVWPSREIISEEL